MISDRLGRLHLPSQRHRLISIVPSWTEYLADIGENNNIIGRTKYCIYPEEINSIKDIGGTKNPNIKEIVNLNPDLIIANKEENKPSDINQLRSEGLNVFTTGAITIDEAIDEMEMIEHVICNSSSRSEYIRDIVDQKQINTPNYSFLYFVWYNPIMVASGSTYISHVIEASGGQNLVLNNWNNRYPKLTMEDLQKLNPDYIFLPNEPYNFSVENQRDMQNLFPNSVVQLIDGKLASWYGNRLIDGIEYFSNANNS